MSRLLINHYLSDLSRLKQVSGTHRESVVREAFKDLLKGYARSHDLVFVPEFEIESPAKERRYVDGALLHALRLPFGYWEAKDEKDDLDAEIAIKFKRGYPKDNIIFEDSTQAALIQNGIEVMRCKVDDVDNLQKLLGLFFGYQRPEITLFRKAVEQFTTDLPQVLEALRAMIEKAHDENPVFRKAAQVFLDHARKTINPSLTVEDVREILIQHILTDEIFDTVFPGQVFHKDNNVAQELHKLEDTFFSGNTKHQLLKNLEVYYAAIRSAAARISNHHEKQTFLKVVYENFYKVYNPKAADRLGVVYTPGEIVRFMIESADWLCELHFKRNLIDRDVEILDPAVGTGTFITELIEHFRGQPAKLKHKYTEELHANEVGILPYYVANLNIEATYAAIAGDYIEFPGLCLVDTLDNVAGLGKKTGDQLADLFGMGDENIGRIKRQNHRKISVIIGNPPYNANQLNENDNNKNREYPEIDRRIKDSYIKASTAKKTKRYDMYSRFYRWASDRLAEHGMIAFITNRNFLDAREADGFRKTLIEEFNHIYIVDLGGDMRQAASEAAANVFGIKVGVAIAFLVRNGNKREACIDYAKLDQPTREDRLASLSKDKISTISFERIKPSDIGTWLDVVEENGFSNLLPLILKTGKRKKSIFSTAGLGVSTNRDSWLIDTEEDSLMEKVSFLSKKYKASGSAFDPQVKWSETLKRHRKRGADESLSMDRVRGIQYRPFCTRLLYDSEVFIDRRGLLRLEPSSTPNAWIALSSGARSNFGLLASLHPMSLDYFVPSAAVGLPQIDANGDNNITDWALKQFRDHYQAVTPAEAGVQRLSDSHGEAAAKSLGSRLRRNDEQKKSGKDGPKQSGTSDAKITKDAIFHYVYAVLHDPIYREKYAQNLKREFPRIPLYGNAPADFWRWAGWGKSLMALHIGYESVEPWPLARTDIEDEKARRAGQSPKPSLKADKPTGRIVLDSETILSGIPLEVWDYKLGNRSALEWILDQYKESKPRDPTIREKFDTYRFADHKDKVIDLLTRVTRVSIDTQEIVAAMGTAPR